MSCDNEEDDINNNNNNLTHLFVWPEIGANIGRKQGGAGLVAVGKRHLHKQQVPLTLDSGAPCAANVRVSAISSGTTTSAGGFFRPRCWKCIMRQAHLLIADND